MWDGWLRGGGQAKGRAYPSQPRTRSPLALCLPGAAHIQQHQAWHLLLQLLQLLQGVHAPKALSTWLLRPTLLLLLLLLLRLCLLPAAAALAPAATNAAAYAAAGKGRELLSLFRGWWGVQEGGRGLGRPSPTDLILLCMPRRA